MEDKPKLKEIKLTEANEVIAVREKVVVETFEEQIDANFLLTQYNDAKLKYNDLEDEKIAIINNYNEKQLEIVEFLDISEPVLLELGLVELVEVETEEESSELEE